MASQEALSRSGITVRVGIPNDVMTFWVRRGLVRPIYAPAGVGRHLKFEWYEANIAAVMSQLRQFGVPIDGLLSIAASYRDAIAWASSYELSREDVGELHELYILYCHHRHGSYDDAELAVRLQKHSDRIKGIHAAMPEAEFRRHLDSFLTITEQPGSDEEDSREPNTEELTYLWRTGDRDEYRFAWGQEGPELARRDGALALIAVDVSAVLHSVWNPSEDEG